MIPFIWEAAPSDHGRAAKLAAALGLSQAVARLLCMRGLEDPEAATRFLHPAIDHLHDPWRLADMRVSVDRLLAAIERRERIAVHGDYDVDGITSTVILRRALEMLGGDVTHVIPERLRDGYGLQPSAIERLHAEGVRVVVSVDCGIRSVDAARRARDLGIDLIVTDHHEPDAMLPPAFGVINPKRQDCDYPDKNLAGVGVAFKVVQALCGRAGREKWLPAFIKMAAIGTLADVVPLVGENRVIAKLGLEWLSRGPHQVGLRALLEASGLAGRTLDSYHIAFVLAPRINAAGRMATPEIATRLLLATDEGMAAEARALAERLNEENLRRQQEERDLVAAARRMVETHPDIGGHAALIVAGENWHRGVIGLVASKLVETFHRPAIVLSIEGDVAHGSCRSIPAFNMLEALTRCASRLIRFGGHRQAAGLTLEAGQVGEFRRLMQTVADEALDPDDLKPRLRLDGALPFRDIGPALAGEMAALEPFGVGNPRPVFQADRVEIVDGPRRLKDRHLKMALRQNGRVLRAIAWRAAEREAFLTEHRAALDLAFSLERNTYRGETSLELSLIDARAPVS